MQFNKISTENLIKIKKHMAELNYANSESSPANMYIWDNELYNNAYCLEDGILYVKCEFPDGTVGISMPYCKTELLKRATTNIIDYFQKQGKKAVISFADENYTKFLNLEFAGRFICKELRNAFDYIYNTDDLIGLRGKKYHSKKNHFNSFNKKYDYEYVQYESHMANECIVFCNKVIDSNQYSSDSAKLIEKESVMKIFKVANLLDLKCAMLKIDNEIIALTVGAVLCNDYAIIHVEKALPEFREAYAVINNLFLKNTFGDIKYVNREDDMGMEGLRKAKLSYHPCKFIKKYRIEFTE